MSQYYRQLYIATESIKEVKEDLELLLKFAKSEQESIRPILQAMEHYNELNALIDKEYYRVRARELAEFIS